MMLLGIRYKCVYTIVAVAYRAVAHRRGVVPKMLVEWWVVRLLDFILGKRLIICHTYLVISTVLVYEHVYYHV